MDPLILQNSDSKIFFDPRYTYLRSWTWRGFDILHSVDSIEPNQSIPLGGIPFLFPFAGRSWDDTGQLGYWSFQNRSYPMPAHGFFHKALNWTIASHTPSALHIIAESTAQSRVMFPFAFELIQNISLSIDQRLDIQCTVTAGSQNPYPMPLSPGWHPFFLIDEDSYVMVASSNCFPVTTQGSIDLAQPSIKAEDLLKASNPILQNSILYPYKTQEFQLVNKNFTVSNSANWNSETNNHSLVFWSKPKSDGNRFQCIEPWFSLPDASRRKMIFSLAPGASRSFSFSIKISPR